MQLHEIPAGINHVIHLQVGGHGEHSGGDAGCQREAGGVHEVEQQGDAGWVQGAGERDKLLPAATTLLEQRTARVQRVEEPTGRKGNTQLII